MEEFRFTELLKLFIPMGLIIILFFTVIFVIILPYSKNNLIETENDKIRQLVESELQIIDSLENDHLTGKISEGNAKKLAVDLIRDQRHGDSQEFYFWILDMDTKLIMHPFRPELENTYVGNYSDPDGNFMFQNMVDLVKESGGGYVEYQWQVLDDKTNIADKKSYVEGYEPWGWIIGTGFYKNTTFKNINRLFLLITLISVIVMIIIIIVSGIVIRQRFNIRKKNKYFAKSLMESEKRYKILIDSMNDGFVIQDKVGVFQLVNNQFESMLGFAENELIGTKLIDLIPDVSRELFLRNINERKLGKDTPYEIYMKSKDGSILPVLVSPRGMFSDDREYQGSFSTITNISSMKEIETALSHSLEEKDVLIKELHHRVKNNLQIIISLLNMQNAEINEPSFLSMITDFETRLQSMALVHEILYESENFKYIPFDEYVQRLLSESLVLGKNYQMDVKLKISIEKIKLPIDSAVNCGFIINELFTNSLNHAFNDMNKDKEIKVASTEKNGSLMISFSDNGSGLAVDKNNAPVKKTGLKLVYLMSEQMNGSVEIISSPSEGTRFEILLSI